MLGVTSIFFVTASMLAPAYVSTDSIVLVPAVVDAPPSDEVQKVWTIVRDARDAALTRLQTGLANGEAVSGAALDAAAVTRAERAEF